MTADWTWTEAESSYPGDDDGPGPGQSPLGPPSESEKSEIRDAPRNDELQCAVERFVRSVRQTVSEALRISIRSGGWILGNMIRGRLLG